MNTQVTRPGHMIPGWSPADMQAIVEAEERAGNRVVGMAILSLALAFFAGILWTVFTVMSFETPQPQAQPVAAISHVI